MYLELSYSYLRPKEGLGLSLVNLKHSPLKVVALSKKADRFLSLLATTAGNSQISNRLINKFVVSSPKSASLEALSYLLSPEISDHLAHHAVPLYLNIIETSWYNWNPKLVAQIGALTYKQGKKNESKAFILNTLQCKSERDVCMFLCELLHSQANYKSKSGFEEAYNHLVRLVDDSSSVYVKRQCRKAMVKGLCHMGKPEEAERLMAGKGAVFEYRCVLEGYGKKGMLSDMERVLKDHEQDAVSLNMVLGLYGAQNGVNKMSEYVKRMKEMGVALTLRTCNTVLNGCPTLMRVVTEAEDLMGATWKEDEKQLVEEMGRSAIDIKGVARWDETEWKLDLHGMHLGTAYAAMVAWMEEIERRIRGGSRSAMEVTMVSGVGKHSSKRGESPVKQLAKVMIKKVGIPMRRDMRNGGCFVAKGKVIEKWVKTKASTKCTYCQDFYERQPR